MMDRGPPVKSLPCRIQDRRLLRCHGNAPALLPAPAAYTGAALSIHSGTHHASHEDVDARLAPLINAQLQWRTVLDKVVALPVLWCHGLAVKQLAVEHRSKKRFVVLVWYHDHWKGPVADASVGPARTACLDMIDLVV